jgi:glycosyltransferase involved in cell wall biosynthesis
MAPDSGRIRVAVVSSVHRWNDTRIFVKQAASLAAEGYNVVLAAICDRPEPFEANGVRVVPLLRRPRPLRWVTWISILRIVVADRSAVVHAHDPELIPLVVLLKLTGRKVICDIHENIAEQLLHKEWIPRLLRWPLSAMAKLVQRALPRLVDAVILAEDSYARDFPSASNVTIVRNFPILPARFKQDYETDTLRLIYVGDVRKVRGILEYVRIVALLAAQHVPAELRVVGSFADRAEEAETAALIRELGLEKRIHFLGRRPPEEIPVLLNECDVGLALLHPIGNYRESYPTKMFEYMAAGLPVVASWFALWESVIVGNECGRVVDPLNVDAGAAAVREYWSSPGLRERHGRNGRAAVVGRYGWSVEWQALRRVYERLVT